MNQIGSNTCRSNSEVNRFIDFLTEVKTFRPAVSVGLNPTVDILMSGFRPRGLYLSILGVNPDVQKSDSGFRPRGLYLSILGVNPDVQKSDSGFRPRVQYLATVGLNPAGYILYSGFTPRDQYLSSVGLDPVTAILYCGFRQILLRLFSVEYGSKPRVDYLMYLGLNPEIQDSTGCPKKNVHFVRF